MIDLNVVNVLTIGVIAILFIALLRFLLSMAAKRQAAAS